VLFNSALKHAIRKVQVNQVIVKLNGTHKLLVYAAADDGNILVENTNSTKTQNV
jgi:hypothetical protein